MESMLFRTHVMTLMDEAFLPALVQRTVFAMWTKGDSRKLCVDGATGFCRTMNSARNGNDPAAAGASTRPGVSRICRHRSCACRTASAATWSALSAIAD